MANLPGELADTVPNMFKLRQAFYVPEGALQPVKFGTSGHRGVLGAAFSIHHVLAVAQAVADLRAELGYTGWALLGGDTRLMSAATARLCAEVLTANGATVVLAGHALPTPVFSLMIRTDERFSDGIIGTASHNPPMDMGIKYNPAHGGPAEETMTKKIQDLANEYLTGKRTVKRQSLDEARAQGRLIEDMDLIGPYIKLLAQTVDLEAVKQSGLSLRIHPLGGAALPYFEALIKWGITSMEVVDRTLDPTFGFVPLDHDCKIRMDPSSPYPLKPLLALVSADRFEMAGATDPDSDRFGVATGKTGLLNPNHALCVAADYLMSNRTWPEGLTLGRTIGTTHLLDRIAAAHGRPAPDEVNVGFKWFVDGLVNDKYALVGEESAGLSFYRWTTEKDGIAAVMLFAEIMAKTGKDVGELYQELAKRHGTSYYSRYDQPASDAAKSALKALTDAEVQKRLASVGGKLAGDAVVRVRTTDGIKLYLADDHGWVLARPSGTEAIVKLYTESFVSEAHRAQLQAEAAKLFGL